MHWRSAYIVSVLNDWLSGLWHHEQQSGHPFKKTVVRMPGPSCMEKRIRLKINPTGDPEVRCKPVFINDDLCLKA
jgi:hypothetical protein